MTLSRILSVSVALGSLAACVSAQMDGPSPLAWRWVQSTSVAPSGSPVVDGNMVYVAVGQRVYALDRASGNQRWKYPPEGIAGNFRVEPIKMGNTIIAAADNKTIYGIDATTGEKKWQYDSLTPILGQPAPLSNNRIAIAMSDNTINVLSSENGEAIWAGPQRIFDGITGRISSYLGNILVMTQVNDLLAIDGSSGKTAWKRNFSSLSSDSRAIVYGDNIFVNSNTFVVCLSGSGGSFKWNSDAGDIVTYPPAVSPDGVAVATRDGHIVVFDVTNGRRITHQEPDPRQPNRTITVNSMDLGSYPQAPAAAVGHVFVFPTTAGTLTMFDPKTGHLLWNYTIKPLGHPAAETASTGGGTGRFGSGGSSTPAPLPPTSVQVAGPPVTAGSTILALARDGSLLAFDRTDGVDVTPPSVKMTWPHPGDQTTSKGLEVHFQIDDEACGLRTDSVSVSVDGKAMDFKMSRDGDVMVRFAVGSKNGLMSDGRHVFTVTATDWLGNTLSQTYALAVDNALPAIGNPVKDNSGGSGRPGGPGGPGGGSGGGSDYGGGLR